jgi:hypothetical protein
MTLNPVENPDRTAQLRQLRVTVQALARSASDQLSLFREPGSTADALAVDFSNAASLLLAEDDDLSNEQRDALAAIEGKLRAISRDGAEFDLDLWTDMALHTSDHWTEMRRLAVAAIDAFGWKEPE